MDSRGPGMTPEQLAAMRSAVDNVNGGWGSSQPTTQPTPPPGAPPAQADNPYIVNPGAGTVPAPTSSSPSRTELMRQQMRQNRGQTPTQSVQMQQGDTYQPTQQTAPTQPAQQPVQQVQQTQQTQQPQQNNSANRTVINTTQRTGVDNQNNSDNGGNGGFQMNMKSAGIIAAIVLVLIAVFVVVFGMRGKDKNTDESTSTEQTQPSEELEWIVPDTPVSSTTVTYLTADVEALRAVGYTADEIESYSAAGIPAKDLIKEAEARRDAYVQETYSKLFDTTSEDFRYYTSQTWLTLPERNDISEWTQTSGYQMRKNLDYEKIDVHGNQLFIKVYLDDNLHEDWFYLNVTPEEWLALDDFGNVIVNYTYQVHFMTVQDEFGGTTIVEDTENIYIIDASLEIIR